jgi:DNA-binding response OmpR family regulator
VQRDSLQTSHKSEKRVLVVDDNEVIANTLSMVLRSAGYYAVAAYSGKQALELLRSDSIDLLLSDVMMPQMTGIELAIEATRKRHVQSVLLMSGVSATADLLTNARKLGYHFEILAKPMHPDEVIDRIRNLLSGEGAAGVDSSLSS